MKPLNADLHCHSTVSDGLLVPAEMANTYYHIAHQHRSAWTFEMAEADRDAIPAFTRPLLVDPVASLAAIATRWLEQGSSR